MNSNKLKGSSLYGSVTLHISDQVQSKTEQHKFFGHYPCWAILNDELGLGISGLFIIGKCLEDEK